MKPEIQRIYEETLETEPRSKLDPYVELILRWRRQGKTYRKICQLLQHKCDVAITVGTLFRYMRRRSRPRKQEELDLATTPTAAKPHYPTSAPSHSSGQTRAEMLAFLAQEKARPVAPKPVIEKLFEYTDEDASNPIKKIQGEPT